MKKIVLLVMIIFLTACSATQIEEVTFNEKTYTFQEVSSDGYDMFVSDGLLLEIKYEEEEFTFITVIEEDIFMVKGNQDSYEITKNGSTILIDGQDKEPTGTENVSWNEDILAIMNLY